MRHHVTPKNPVLHPMFGASITKFWERINKKPGLFGTRRKNQRFRDIQGKLQKLQLLFSDYSLDLGVAISPGLAVEADGTLLVADRGNARLMRIREGG